MKVMKADGDLVSTVTGVHDESLSVVVALDGIIVPLCLRQYS